MYRIGYGRLNKILNNDSYVHGGTRDHRSHAKEHRDIIDKLKNIGKKYT